jgi:hypothetical protein
VQRVGGDHHTGQVQVGQQWPQPARLARRAVDLPLGKDGAGGVVHRGEQVDLPALVAAGTAQRLAAGRDRPWLSVGTVAVGQPGADRGGQGLGVKPGKDAADRGFAGDRPHPVTGEGSRRVPSVARTGWGASAAQSTIAAIDRASARRRPAMVKVGLLAKAALSAP